MGISRNGWVATLGKFAFLAAATIALATISAQANDVITELPQITDATGEVLPGGQVSLEQITLMASVSGF